MNLKETAARNHDIFKRWYLCGMPEASEELNGSNFDLIAAYKKEYPEAKGYKAHEGIVSLEGKLYNFCCDVIFNGSKEAIDAINSAKSEIERMEKAEKADGKYLVWS